MKRIASRDNPTFKSLRHLASSARERHLTGQCLLDGLHLCEVYLDRVGIPRLCAVAESALGERDIERLLLRLGSREVLIFDDRLLQSISHLEGGARIMFVIDKPVPAVPRVCDRDVLLDRVQDPGNLGTILRTAAAAGVAHVFCSTGTAALWSPKVLRAGMGAHFQLQLNEDCDLGHLMDTSGIGVIATSPGATRSIYDQDLCAKAAWIFGNEGQGVDPNLLRAATGVRIPQAASVESLNVAAAVAVCLFEQCRQRIANASASGFSPESLQIR